MSTMTDLLCPKCQAPMRVMDRNGVTVERCTECGGIILDRGELERLMRAEGEYNQRTYTGYRRDDDHDDDDDDYREHEYRDNSSGQLGVPGAGAMTEDPVRLGVATDHFALAAGETHTCSLQRTGVLTCWGGNQDGEVGDGTTAQRDLAFTVSPTEDWTAVAAGHHHTCAIRADNTLWCWGRNSTGQLGDGTGGQITP